MDIVIISEFCGDFSEIDNGRFLYIAKMLVNNYDDTSVEIITSSFRHATKKQRTESIEHWPFKVTFIEEPGYPKNVCLKRFYSHYIWGKNVAEYLMKRKKPDIVYCAVPSLTAPLAAAKYCEKNGIRFIIDIQDLWPEAFKLVFNVPVIKDIVFFPFRNRADGIFSRADTICGVSKTYVDRALKVNKKVKEGYVVFLGTQLSTFDDYVANNHVTKPENEIWLAYCGTLGASYDITVVIDALHILTQRGINPPKFIIMGDGERRAEFETYARDLGVKCEFTGRLPYNQMCGRLAACDIAANPIMHNAAQSIINKHGDYASAGLPVINTQENQEYRDLIKEYQMGYNVKNNDANEFADKLQILIEDQVLRTRMGKGARRCAKERFDRGYTYRNLINVIIK